MKPQIDCPIRVLPEKVIDPISEEDLIKLLRSGWLPFWDRKITEDGLIFLVLAQPNQEY